MKKLEILMVAMVIAILTWVIIPLTAEASQPGLECSENVKCDSEYHEGDWEPGGYRDTKTIVTVPQVQQVRPEVLDQRAADEWNMRQLRSEAVEPERGYSMMVDAYNHRGPSMAGVGMSRLVPAIDYPERIQENVQSSEPKRGLTGPTMGFSGARFRVKHYSTSEIETRTPMPPQVSYR